MSPVGLVPGVSSERMGGDLMVMVPGAKDVALLSGRRADVFLDVSDGKLVDSSDPAVQDLVDLGILSAPGLSRRGLIKSGAIVAGSGIALLAMPGVAAASSASDVLGWGGYAVLYEPTATDIQAINSAFNTSLSYDPNPNPTYASDPVFAIFVAEYPSGAAPTVGVSGSLTFPDGGPFTAVSISEGWVLYQNAYQGVTWGTGLNIPFDLTYSVGGQSFRIREGGPSPFP